MTENVQEIAVPNLPITLAQLLKWAGVVITGGEAKELIQAGLVDIDGEIELSKGKKVLVGSRVSLHNQDNQVELTLVVIQG